MSATAPWSVKGIDPQAREIAKDLARRSGQTLGEWINSMIIEGGKGETAPPARASEPERHAAPERQPSVADDRRPSREPVREREFAREPAYADDRDAFYDEPRERA